MLLCSIGPYIHPHMNILLSYVIAPGRLVIAIASPYIIKLWSGNYAFDLDAIHRKPVFLWLPVADWLIGFMHLIESSWSGGRLVGRFCCMLAGFFFYCLHECGFLVFILYVS